MMRAVLACVLCIVAFLALAGAQNPIVNFPAAQYNSTNLQIVAWAFPTPTSVIIATGDGKVYSSVDNGVTWTAILRWNKISNIIQQNSTIYFFPITGTNFFYSTNGGANIFNVTLPVPWGQVQANAFQPHPTQAGWVLLGTCSQNNLCSMYYTKNYGQSWTAAFASNLALGPFISWGNDTSSPDTVFLIQKNGEFGYTQDYSKVFVLFQNAVGFVITNHYQFVATQDGPTTWLYASSYRDDATHTQRGSYNLADFPFGNNIPNGYTFLDDTTRAEYLGLHVRYPSGTQPQWGDIYSSQFDGAYYQLSASHIYWNSGVYDFHRVRSLNGIYIANHVQNWQELNEAAKKGTLVTLDNGAEWRFLDAPNADMNGNPFACSTPSTWGCSLHLHPDTSSPSTIPGLNYPGWRTHTSAVGMIIGNGNVGTSLSYAPTEVSTFLSRDGGLSWNQIYSEATIFEFGNHGGILLMAPAMTITSFILYSFDYGNTTNFYQFTTNTTRYMYVTSIFTEPYGNGQQFVINGWAPVANATEWFVYTVDLSVFQLRACGTDDFETFIPSNGDEAQCFMGATTTYTRRKQSSICYNTNTDSDTIISQTPCPCAIDDYECDFNYEMTFNGSTTFNCTRLYALPTCDDGSDSYWEETGYALVPDTMCSPTAPGALNLVATKKSCPKKKHPAEVAAAVIVTLLVVGGVVAVGVLYWKNDRFRNWILSFKGSSHRYSEINNHD